MSRCSLFFFLFSSVFCILNFVLLGEPRAKMFILYMLPYYIILLCLNRKILKCGMCWCVLLSYLVVRCVLSYLFYNRRNTSKTAAKPPQIGATSISFRVVMLHIAYYASIMPQSNLPLLPPAYATSHASKGHLCYLEEMLAYEVKP